MYVAAALGESRLMSKPEKQYQPPKFKKGQSPYEILSQAKQIAEILQDPIKNKLAIKALRKDYHLLPKVTKTILKDQGIFVLEQDAVSAANTTQQSKKT